MSKLVIMKCLIPLLFMFTACGNAPQKKAEKYHITIAIQGRDYLKTPSFRKDSVEALFDSVAYVMAAQKVIAINSVQERLWKEKNIEPEDTAVDFLILNAKGENVKEKISSNFLDRVNRYVLSKGDPIQLTDANDPNDSLRRTSN